MRGLVGERFIPGDLMKNALETAPPTCGGRDTSMVCRDGYEKINSGKKQAVSRAFADRACVVGAAKAAASPLDQARADPA